MWKTPCARTRLVYNAIISWNLHDIKHVINHKYKRKYRAPLKSICDSSTPTLRRLEWRFTIESRIMRCTSFKWGCSHRHWRVPWCSHSGLPLDESPHLNWRSLTVFATGLESGISTTNACSAPWIFYGRILCTTWLKFTSLPTFASRRTNSARSSVQLLGLHAKRPQFATSNAKSRGSLFWISCGDMRCHVSKHIFSASFRSISCSRAKQRGGFALICAC